MIIGIGHKMRQGKDTLADYISMKYGFEKVAFASVLKDEVSSEIFPIIYYYKYTKLLVLSDKYQNRFEMYSNTPYKDIYNSFLKYLNNTNKYESDDIIVKTGVKEKDRELLQIWGDFRRTVYGKNYFVDRVMARSCGRDIVISDVRFRNEAEEIKKRYGILIKVQGRKIEEKFTNHVSENDLNDFKFDYEIDNSGSFKNLYLQADRIMKEINAR